VEWVQVNGSAGGGEVQLGADGESVAGDVADGIGEVAAFGADVDVAEILI
jgi:hypothetical protein